MMAFKKMALFVVNMYGGLEQDFSQLKFRNSSKTGPSLTYTQGGVTLKYSYPSNDFNSEEISKLTIRKLCTKVVRWDEFDAIMRKSPEYENFKKFGEAVRALRGG